MGGHAPTWKEVLVEQKCPCLDQRGDVHAARGWGQGTENNWRAEEEELLRENGSSEWSWACPKAS